MDIVRKAVVACLGMLAVPFLMGFGFLISLAATAVLAWPLMWSWNYVVPAVFHLQILSYWQAFSLMVLSTLLLKGIATGK